MSYISDYKVSGNEEEYRIQAAAENAYAKYEEKMLEMQDNYDLCFATGFYDNDDCENCPHKESCSGYEDE